MTDVAVIIRVRDGAHHLRECLPVIAGQQHAGRVRVVVVDNESTDDTVDVARSFGAEIVPISVGDFSWGRAINRGLAACTEPVAVILSADACPVNDQWLQQMMRPFEDPLVAAVYGRQCPRDNAPVDEIVRLAQSFRPEPKEMTPGQMEDDLKHRKWVCSNACAAVGLAAWRQVPFDEQVPAAEEVGWVKGVLAGGWKVKYEPGASVYHSHYEPVLRMAMREWELYQNTVRRTDIRGIRRSSGWLALVLAKRRIGSVRSGLAPASACLRGLARLPLECAAILMIGLLSLNAPSLSRFRAYAWGKR